MTSRQIEYGYRSPVACRVSGVTYRQLDYWTRTGLITPTRESFGSGSHRLWSRDDIIRLRIIRACLDSGIYLHRIRRIVDDDYANLPLDETFIVVTAVKTWTGSNADTLLRALRSSAAAWVVNVAGIVDDVTRSLESYDH